MPPTDYVDLACKCLRVRVSRLLRACALLIHRGYAQESSVLVRSLWEDAVSAAFIAEKPAERAQRWVKFGDQRRIHHLQRALDNPLDMDSSDRAKLAAAVAGQECSTSADWAGTSASSLARGLSSSKNPLARSLSRDFDLMYEDLCDIAHGSPFAVDKLLTASGEGAFVDVGPTFSDVDDPASLAVYAACQFAVAIEPFQDDIRLDDVQIVSSRLSALRAPS